MMEEQPTQAVASRTIVAAPDNAAAMQAAIRGWPELHALVQRLQADGLFPGLRGMQFTLTGAPDWVAGGLASLPAKKAPMAPPAASKASRQALPATGATGSASAADTTTTQG